MAANTETGVTVIDQGAESGVVEWNLDEFPTDKFNRLIPTQTLMLPTDLLRPVVQIVKLNPDPTGGDVYTSRDTPSGHAAPTRVALRKFAMAAGISVVDERRVDDGRDPDVIEMLCMGEMLLPTGQRIRATGSKRIDLNAQKWESDNHRLKYRSFFQEHVASRAQNRMIRALLSLRGSYPIEVYQRPFAVVSFAPNMAHPEVRERILDAMTGSTAQLYGPAAARQLAPGQTIDVTPAVEEDPAPATPTVLPGERLAAAATAEPDETMPSWASDQPAKAAGPSEPDLATRIRDKAATGGLTGPAKKPQVETLKEIFGVLRGPATSAGLLHLWPDLDMSSLVLSANQAQSLIGAARQAESYDAFAVEWRSMLPASESAA